MAGNKFLTNNNGSFLEVHALQASAGAASAGSVVGLSAAGLIDQTMMPVGVGPDTQLLTASEAIAAGAFVNVWSNGGVFAIRNADGSTTGKEAHGFVLAAVANGAVGTVYLGGTNTAVTGLAPGVQYLSATTLGGATSTAPSAAGQTVQRIGIAVSATALNFTYETPITLA